MFSVFLITILNVGLMVFYFLADLNELYVLRDVACMCRSVHLCRAVDWKVII